MKALSNKLNFWTQLIIGFLLTAILIAIPTGYEGALIYTESVKCKAEVISTDESSIISTSRMLTMRLRVFVFVILSFPPSKSF